MILKPVSNVLYPAELNSHGTYWKIWNTAWHWLISRVFLLFLVYESYEISRCRNQNLEITTKSEILRWTNHTNPETLSPTNSHHETFSKFLAVLGLSKILAILEGSEQIFPRKRSLGAPVDVAGRYCIIWFYALTGMFEQRGSMYFTLYIIVLCHQ